MFTDGLDQSAVEWVQGDSRNERVGLLTPSVDVLSPRLARDSILPGPLTGKRWDLPPSQLESPHLHSRLINAHILLVAPAVDDGESVGSVSASGQALDGSSESEAHSIDSSPKLPVYHADYEHFSCSNDGNKIPHPELCTLDSRLNSRCNSRCSSARQTFGQKKAYKVEPETENFRRAESSSSELLNQYQDSVGGQSFSQRRSSGNTGSPDDCFGEVYGNRNFASQMKQSSSRNKDDVIEQCENCKGSFSGVVGASPSAPPMVGSASIETCAGVEGGCAISTCDKSHKSIPRGKDKSPAGLVESEKDLEQRCDVDSSCLDEKSRGALSICGEEIDPVLRQTATSNSPSLGLPTSGLGSWQSVIAYDACVRLCLRAWARGCIEAPEFLMDECALLRNAFGLQSLLLQPHDDAGKNIVSDDNEPAAVVKPKNNTGKVKVQVKKIRVFSRQSFQSTYERGTAYIQAGAQYIRQVLDLLKSGVKTLRSTSVETQEAYCCRLRLKSTALEEANLVQPGTTDVTVFYPQCSGDDLVLEIQDSGGSVVGSLIIPLISFNDDQNDQVRWWPIGNEQDHECVGKVQLYISYSIQSSESMSSKMGRVSETVAYDTVLEVAMRAHHFQQRNLRLHGKWKWLLDEFAVLYGISNTYASLRYLACIMEVATPTEDCLVLIHELLFPILKAPIEIALSRQEKRMLLDVQDQVERLVATIFENYKALDESSLSGIRDVIVPVNGKPAPALVPAVQIFTLLHDILAAETQNRLCNYFQWAAKKRCRRHLSETNEYIATNNEGFLLDPMTVSLAYAKMKALCFNLRNEIRTDIEMHQEHILPSSIDLPSITSEIYSGELCHRLKAFLVAWPPTGPSSSVVDLLFATSDFQQDLASWKIRGSIDAKDLFHLYIDLWINDKRLSLLDHCKLDKLRGSGGVTPTGTSLFVEEMYERIKDTLNEYDVLLIRWPEYTTALEAAIADIETAVIGALERQFADVLMPLKNVMITKKFSLQYMQKLTRRHSLSMYTIPNQLGIVLNTIKRLLDVLQPKMEAQMKSWICMPLESGEKSCFGERLNEVTVLLRAKYKNFVQAIVEKLADNARLHVSTRLKKILQDTREVGGELEMRDRMQPLSMQLLDTMNNINNVFSTRVFVAICHAYWDRISQDVLHFLENRKENRSWYKASYFALLILDDIFASQMQKLQGHALQEKDLEPPRSVVEARSMLSKDAPNGMDSTSYFYF